MEYLYLSLFGVVVIFFCRAAHAYQGKHEAEVEKMAAEAKSAALKVLREVAFDAIAFSAEEAAKAKKTGTVYRPETKLQVAVDYIRRNLSHVSPQEAGDMVESVLAKINKEGATGNEAIRK